MQRDMEEGRRTVVGVNKFVAEESPLEGLLRVDPRVGERQRRRLAKLRRSRDEAKVRASLARLADAAQGSDNTMPVFIECAESCVTLGEMCDVLRGVWGEQKESLVF
jgi:methylmalonyl-CoA mutase N-terminal domain/subunit